MSAGEPNLGAETLRDQGSERAPELLPIGPTDHGGNSIEEDLAALTRERGEESQEKVKASDLRAFRMRRVLAFADVTAICAAWLLSGVVLSLLGRATASVQELLLFVAFVPLWVLLASLNGLYHDSQRRIDPSVADEAGRLIALITMWTWGYLLVRGAIETGANQLMPAILLWGVSIAALLAVRPLARHFAHSRPWYWQNVIVVGRDLDIERVWRRLMRHPEYGLRVVDTPDLWEALEEGDGLERLVRHVEEKRAARVIVATAPHSVQHRGNLIRRLREADVQVDLATGVADSFAPSVMLNYLEGIPVMSVPRLERSKAARFMKRMFDLFGGAAAIFLLSPLIALCALRIKLDSRGPVFFRQERVGKDGKMFKVFKFRSMVDGADARKAEVEAMNMHAREGGGLMFKIPADPRITKVGAWLRRWSLDELPQLFNVVRGEMSLVGPRPLIAEEANRIDEHYMARFSVLPGMTGTWQAHGRSDIGFEDMVELDYTYVANWSFAEDLKLVLRTVEVILHGRGAY